MSLWKTFRMDTNGFSTTFDVLLFLVMVSICGVILLPTITGNTQIKSVIEAKNQKQSSEMLLTLMNGRVNEFEYFTGGEQLDAIAGPLNKSSIYLAGKKLITGKEIKHKTFTDIAMEDVASRWVIYHEGKNTQLNFLTTDYNNRLNFEIKKYLDDQIEDRYNYNFKVVWRPVVNAPFGADVEVGDPVPANAYVESAIITMPYHVNVTRKDVEGLIESSFNTSSGNISATFDEIKNNDKDRAKIEEEINIEIFDAINQTIDDTISKLVDDKMGPVLDGMQDNITIQINNFLPGAGTDLIALFNESMLTALDDEGAVINGTVSETLKSHLQELTKQETRRIAGEEMKAFVTDIVDLYVNGNMSMNEVKDRILTEVFSRISVNRATITLSIWDKRI